MVTIRSIIGWFYSGTDGGALDNHENKDGTGDEIHTDGMGAIWTRSVDCSLAPIVMTGPIVAGGLAAAIAAITGGPKSGIASGFRVISGGPFTIIDAQNNSATWTQQPGEGYNFPIKDVIVTSGTILVFV
jgi:hypothetical protein